LFVDGFNLKGIRRRMELSRREVSVELDKKGCALREVGEILEKVGHPVLFV